jgi:Spy/CpxP family protein refolding chaperone
MRVAKVLLGFAVLLMLVGSVSAQERKFRHEGKHMQHPMMEQGDMVIPMGMLKCLNLTEDQKAKLETLKKEYAPKVKASFEKHTGILTEDQKKARQEAVKSAKAAGKSHEEVWKEAQAAVKLTDDQKAKMETARKEGQALRKEIHEKIMEILTPEQREQFKKELDQHHGPMAPMKPTETLEKK